MPGLMVIPQYREHIVIGVQLWIQGHELTRRNMLLLRCSALDRTGFPRRPAPGMVAAADAARDWLSGLPVNGLPGENLEALTLEATRLLAQKAFTPAQIQAWNKFQPSPDGQRGLAVAHMNLAIDRVAELLVDVNTGRSWSWPLAKLRNLADDLGQRTALDLAFDEVVPGARVALTQANEVPGVSQADQNVLDQIGASSEALGHAYFAHVLPQDLAAYRKLLSNEVYSRWAELAQSLRDFALPSSKTGFLPPSRGTVAPPDYCARMQFKGCEVGSPMYRALEGYRARLVELIETDRLMRGARQLVTQMPAAGCP